MSAQWEVRFSRSRQLPYFYDAASGESTWEQPEGLTAEQVQALPGAEQLKAGGTAGDASAGSDGRVRASHLLVKHNKSRRPSSWKEVSEWAGGIELAAPSASREPW